MMEQCSKLDFRVTKEYLDELYTRFNCVDFIEDDPISLPHRFEQREDIEIAGFLASTIAWGNRKAIVKSALKMINMLDNDPYNFIMGASEQELFSLSSFVHRTFNGGDFIYFIRSLSNIYKNYGGLGTIFENDYALSGDIRVSLSNFYKIFFELEHPDRVHKHISSIDKKGACKRLCMYIKWMVRDDENGVDFGLWNIPTSALYLPLDVHTANVGRQMGLLSRKQNDWKSVEQITASLRSFDSQDPVKYDFALFGAGVSGMFK